jgi:hypothetical protein
MEFLLLWIDDLDDALGALRHLAPKIVSFFAATVLFAATGCAFVLAPHVTLVVIAAALSASLFEAVRRRRTRAPAQRDMN